MHSSSHSPKSPTAPAPGRSRISQACIACANRKHRCDGVRPTCGRCRKNDTECVYTPANRRYKRKHVEIADKDSSDAGWEQDATFQEDDCCTELTFRVGVPDVKGVPFFHREMMSSGVILCLGYDLPFSEVRSPWNYVPSHNVMGSTSLLPVSLIRRLLKHYWQFVHPSWPVIYKPGIADPASDGIYNFLPSILVNSMLAAASGTLRDVDDDLIDTMSTFFAGVEHELLYNVIAEPTASTCQALILMTIKLQRDGAYSKAWQFLGMACRMIQDLVLHRRPTDTDDQQEISRRTYWACYLMDKLLSTEMGRPYILRSRDADVEMPSETEADEFELSSSPFESSAKTIKLRTLSTFNAFCRLGLIYETVLDCRNKFSSCVQRASVIDTIHKSCLKWKSDLPSHLQYKDPVKNQMPIHILEMHFMYLACISLLHVTILTEAMNEPKTETIPNSTLSITACKDAAEDYDELIIISWDMVDVMLGCFPFIFPDFLISIINCRLATPKNLQNNKRLIECYSDLTKYKTFFPVHTGTMQSILFLQLPMELSSEKPPDTLLTNTFTDPSFSAFADWLQGVTEFENTASQLLL